MNLNETETVFNNPWTESIDVNGTDGNQFHPNVKEDEILTAFVNNFARSGLFSYKDSTFDAYPCGVHKSVELMNFYLTDEIMQNKHKNPDNVKYNTQYDGTINMDTVLRAYAIGTKGHFY